MSRRLRRTAVVAAAAAAVLAAPQAGASPFAGQYRYLYSGDIAVTGADGATWVLSVFATARTSAQSRNEQRLYVDLLRCPSPDDCESRGRWSRALQDSEINVPEDYGTGTVRTTLGGLRLDVDLKAVAVTNLNSSTIGYPATGFTGLGLDPDEGSVSPAVVQYHGANGVISLGRLSCRVTQDHAELGEITGVDTFGEDARYADGTPAALPAGFVKGPRAARC